MLYYCSITLSKNNQYKKIRKTKKSIETLFNLMIYSKVKNFGGKNENLHRRTKERNYQ